MLKPLAQRPVADLIVILDAVHKARQRQIVGRRAARPPKMTGGLANIKPALPQRRRQIRGAAAVILVVALALVGQRNPQLVMKIVGPDRVEAEVLGVGGWGLGVEG